MYGNSRDAILRIMQTAGPETILFAHSTLNDPNGQDVASGIYFGTMEVADFRQMCKIVLVR